MQYIERRDQEFSNLARIAEIRKMTLDSYIPTRLRAYVKDPIWRHENLEFWAGVDKFHCPMAETPIGWQLSGIATGFGTISATLASFNKSQVQNHPSHSIAISKRSSIVALFFEF